MIAACAFSLVQPCVALGSNPARRTLLPGSTRSSERIREAASGFFGIGDLPPEGSASPDRQDSLSRQGVVVPIQTLRPAAASAATPTATIRGPSAARSVMTPAGPATWGEAVQRCPSVDVQIPEAAVGPGAAGHEGAPAGHDGARGATGEGVGRRDRVPDLGHVRPPRPAVPGRRALADGDASRGHAGDPVGGALGTQAAAGRRLRDDVDPDTPVARQPERCTAVADPRGDPARAAARDALDLCP